MKVFIRYFQLWRTLTINSFLVSLNSRLNAILFLIGKILRFVFFVVFLFALFQRTQFFGNYTILETLFFFLTFNLLDTVTQLFYREVYRFRPMIVSGDFDLILVKPISPLFRALAGGADPLDLFMLIPYGAAIVIVAFRLGNMTFAHTSLYMLFLFNGFLIATGFHILVLALAIVTTEIDHAVMIYRDLTSMGRVPVDIYHEPLRSVITFVIPIGLMMTYPAKAYLGLLKPSLVMVSLIISVSFIFLCFKIWKYALSKYSSASS